MLVWLGSKQQTSAGCALGTFYIVGKMVYSFTCYIGGWGRVVGTSKSFFWGFGCLGETSLFF